MQNMQDTTKMTLTSSLDNLKYPDSVIGHWRSARLRALLPYRNELARDYIMVLDHNPLVSELRALPFALDYYHSGIECEFMPDAMFIREGDAYVMVCLPNERWLSDSEKGGLALVTNWCIEHLCDLEVVTPNTVQNPPYGPLYVENIRLLSRYAGYEVSPSEIQTVISTLQSARKPLAIRILAEALASQAGIADIAPGLRAVLHMASMHLVEVPLQNDELSPATLVWLLDDTFLGFEAQGA